MTRQLQLEAEMSAPLQQPVQQLVSAEESRNRQRQTTRAMLQQLHAEECASGMVKTRQRPLPN